MRPEPLRVLFYSHEGHGLGHLRMFLPLAEALAQRDPTASILIATGAQNVDSGPLPTTIDFVKIPSIRSSQTLAPLRPVQGSGYAWAGLWAIREALLHETVRAFDPHLLIGDNEPAGMMGELARTLNLVWAQTPRARTVLGTFDFLGDRAGVEERWNQFGGMATLERYDRIFVFGQQEIFDPANAYAFPESARAKTRFPGYLVRETAAVDPAEIRGRWQVKPDQPFVVVAAGGGEDGHQLLIAALGAADAISHARFVLVTGPQMAEANRDSLVQRAASNPNVTLTTFVPELPSIFATADVIVIKGGYNSVAEAVSAGKKPIIVPRDDVWTEQRQRALRFAELGLATVILPSQLSPQRLADAIGATLTAKVSPPRLVRTGGIAQAVQELFALAPPSGDRWPPRVLRPATLIGGPA